MGLYNGGIRFSIKVRQKVGGIVSYTALYRKFRPQEFEDVKGQEHIVTTLKNQIMADRIGHAYLFCGTRGTGKTTVAKIFAKAINCEHPVEGSPCGECPTCKAIADGTSMNVIEIDAASNNGVDNIRQIKEEVSYRPTEGRFKVYIIDEVHMLSAGAFNALLKTLEEPPAYVMFILATTESHKIPITILSRCQRYDFHRISIDTIAARLAELMQEEQIDVEEKALRYVAKLGDGSMRDALSLLDQCLAFNLGKTLTYEDVLEVLGAVDTEVFSKLLRQIIKRDVAGAIATLEQLVEEGRELTQLVNDFTWYLRNLMLIQSAEDMEDVLDMSKENLAALKEEAQMVEQEVLMRYIRIFSEVSNQIRHASQKRILLEIALIKLCRPQMEANFDSLIDRMNMMEQKLAQGVAVSSVPAQAAPAEEKVKVQQALPEAVPDDIKEVIRIWQSIVQNLSGLTKVSCMKAKLCLGNAGELVLLYPDTTSYDQMAENRGGAQEELHAAIEERIGKSVQIKFVYEGDDQGKGYLGLDEALSMINIPIEEEDM